jgi:hypothetical protein
MVGIAVEPRDCIIPLLATQKPFNPESKNGFPGFNGGLQLLDLAKMRSETSWWLGDEFLASVKRGLTEFGRTTDQDLYSWLYHINPAAFDVLPRTFNLQMCSFCSRITEQANELAEVLCVRGVPGIDDNDNEDEGTTKNRNKFSTRCTPKDVVVIHGNCDTPPPSKFAWKKLIYAMLTTLHEDKLQVQRLGDVGKMAIINASAGGVPGVGARAGGGNGRWVTWPLNQEQHPTRVPFAISECAKKCDPQDEQQRSTCAFDSRVCALLSAVFVSPAVEPASVEVFAM